MKRANNSNSTSKHKRSRTRQQEYAFLDASKYGLAPKKCIPCTPSNSENKKGQRPSSNDVEGLKLNLDKDGKLVVTEKERKDLETFKTFLSFKTISAEGPSNGEYAKAVSFLQNVAKSLGLETKVYELIKNKPLLVCSYQGTDPSLKSLLLNSHYDVVPAVNEMWHTDPFTPTEEKNGDIYARGAQDMKCVSIQHLLAVGRIIASGTSVSPIFLLSQWFTSICYTQVNVRVERFISRLYPTRRLVVWRVWVRGVRAWSSSAKRENISFLIHLLRGLTRVT